MATTDDRAVGALEDVLAIERGDAGTGMVRVVTMSDCYIVDVRKERCECPDWEYHLEGDGRCKHIWAALDATDQIDAGVHELVDDLDGRAQQQPAVAADGGVAETSERKPIRLVGREWEIRVEERRQPDRYEHVESEITIEGEIPVDVGELSPERRGEIKRELAQLHADVSAVQAREIERKLTEEQDEDDDA